MKKLIMSIIAMSVFSALFGMSRPHAPAVDVAQAFEKGNVQKIRIENVTVVGLPADESPALQLKTACWFPNSHEVLTVYWDGIRPSEGKDSYRIYKYNHEKKEWKGYFSESASGNFLKPVYLSRERMVFEKQYQRRGIGDKIRANEYVSFTVGGGKEYLRKDTKILSNMDSVLIEPRYGKYALFIRPEKKGKIFIKGLFVKNLLNANEWLAATGEIDQPVFLPGGMVIGFTYKLKEEMICFFDTRKKDNVIKVIKVEDIFSKMPAGSTDLNISSVDNTGREFIFTYKNSENNLNFGYFTLSQPIF